MCEKNNNLISKTLKATSIIFINLGNSGLRRTTIAGTLGHSSGTVIGDKATIEGGKSGVAWATLSSSLPSPSSEEEAAAPLAAALPSPGGSAGDENHRQPREHNPRFLLL